MLYSIAPSIRAVENRGPTGVSQGTLRMLQVMELIFVLE